MPDWTDELRQPFGAPLLAAVATGPKLVQRIISTGGSPAKSIVVPAKAGWIRIGTTGSGSQGYRDGGSNYRYGGGGAYAYNDGVVAPGASVSISQINNESGVSITVGTITCSAVSGGPYVTDGANILGGNATDCVGKIRRSGGNGGVGSTLGTAGQNGGIAGYGGSAGGDTDFVDGLGFNGNGGGINSGNGYPGIGGGGTRNDYTGQGTYGGAAGYIIEFWTSDPRA